MKEQKKKILLKLTGEIFVDKTSRYLTTTHLSMVAEQIKALHTTHQFGIVIGGGNFFRGGSRTAMPSLTATTGHQIGMLATMMNGLIIKDVLEAHGVATTLLTAFSCPQVGASISADTIKAAVQNNHTLIFTGGTGNPFFTTDTSAIIRALQMEADQIWKGTIVDGVYSANPTTDAHAHLLKHLSLQEAIDKKLGIMDTTAYVLAQEHKKTIRVFNIFSEAALTKMAHDPDFGSLIA